MTRVLGMAFLCAAVLALILTAKFAVEGDWFLFVVHMLAVGMLVRHGLEALAGVGLFARRTR